MRATNNKGNADTEMRFPNTNQLQNFFGLGRASCVKIGEAAQAKIVIGRRVIWDLKKIENYLDKIASQESAE